MELSLVEGPIIHVDLVIESLGVYSLAVLVSIDEFTLIKILGTFVTKALLD